MFAPGVRWAWRAPDTVQFGVDVPRPLVVAGIPPWFETLAPLLDGVRSTSEVVASVSRQAPEADPVDVTAVIARLTELGLVLDGGTWPGGGSLHREARDRLMPDRRAMTADPRGGPVAAMSWEDLADASVVVLGGSRLGAVLTLALASVGVAGVRLDDDREVDASDVCLGGFDPADVGTPRVDLLRRHSQWAAQRPRRQPSRHLVVVTDAVDIHRSCRELMARSAPHLVVTCRELMGRVGPWVEPGVTACFDCVSLTRRDHDPQWPEVWRQLPVTATPDADGLLVSMTAAMAAAQILEVLRGRPAPTRNGVAEIHAPQLSVTVRRLRPHPSCGCTWPGVAA